MKRTGTFVVAVLGIAGVVSAAGTALSVTFGNPFVTCPDGDVRVEYTISTTAADGAGVVERLTDSLGDLKASRTYAIASGNVPGGWTFAGRTKTYDGVFEASGLLDGTYTLEVCATQAGSGGNPSKTVCRTQTVVVACSQVGNACASEAPFGEVVGNVRIRDHATAQIQFRGDFGPTALVEITNADGFYRSASITRNGNSCIYHANWKFTNDSGADIYGSAGPGVYTVTVSGHGNTLQFAVTVSD
jgi:hypothetical protein